MLQYQRPKGEDLEWMKWRNLHFLKKTQGISFRVSEMETENTNEFVVFPSLAASPTLPPSPHLPYCPLSHPSTSDGRCSALCVPPKGNAVMLTAPSRLQSSRR